MTARNTIPSVLLLMLFFLCGHSFAATPTTSAFAWTYTSSLEEARFDHTGTLLPDGQVLVVGGYDKEIVSSAELYDPASATWSFTGAPITARFFHTATLLPSGKVLIAGGANNVALNSAELYDSATGTFTSTENMVTAARYEHTATLLQDGRVLVAGGQTGSSGTAEISAAEIYDPATGLWTATGSLRKGRFLFAAVLLPDGKVLVAGGSQSTSVAIASAEIYDPITRTWSATGRLSEARAFHTLTLLGNGKVLAAGGSGLKHALRSCELYDPVTGIWTRTADLHNERSAHTATLLADGEVLAAGGRIGEVYPRFAFPKYSEIYDPASGSWTVSGALNQGRSIHSANLLPNGDVLLAGGFGKGPENLTGVMSAELGMSVPP
jgi:galactose oxidase-like protein/Kelch motif protein